MVSSTLLFNLSLLIFLSIHCGKVNSLYEDHWSVLHLSKPRFALSITAVDGLVFFAGGYDNPTATLVEVYNTSNGQWFNTHLSEGRYGIGATSVGHLAMFASGDKTYLNFTTVVDIFNTTDGQWYISQLPRCCGRDGMYGVSVGNYALFAGGYNDSFSTEVSIFNRITNQWSNAYLTEPKASMGVTSIGKFAMFAGGSVMVSQTLRYDTNVIDIFNSEDGSWSTAHLTHNASWVAATSVGNVVLFAYGNHVDIYHTDDGTWSTARLSQSRRRMAAISVGHLALFAGGEVDGVGAVDVVDIYNNNDGTWTTSRLSTPQSELVAASTDKYAFFVNGNGIVEVFSLESQPQSSTSNSATSIPGTTGSDICNCRVGRSCCETAAKNVCYKPDVHTCSINDKNQKVLCPLRSPNSCGPACYSPTRYACVNGKLKTI